MPGLWKAWKAKSRLPTLSTSPLEISPKPARFPHFHRSDGDSLSQNQKHQRAGYRPPPAAALCAASGVIVVDTEK